MVDVPPLPLTGFVEASIVPSDFGQMVMEGAMALEQMGALEGRVLDLVTLVRGLQAKNAQLEQELRDTKECLSKQKDISRQWDAERMDIRARIEKVLGELEVFECLEDSKISKEVALDEPH